MKKFLIVILIITAAIVAAWKVYYPKSDYPSGEWRYKITMEIETPEGIKFGSAVREISARVQPRIKPETHPVSYEVKGEAIAVDLGKHGVVFALVNWTDVEMVQAAFPFHNPNSKEGLNYYKNLPIGKKETLTKWIPQFVMFENLNDPMTVKLVRGGRFNKDTQKTDQVNDFETIFGTGVNLKNVTVEITDEPVTWKIEKILPWMYKIKGGYINGEFTSRNAPLGLHGGNFKKGER